MTLKGQFLILRKDVITENPFIILNINCRKVLIEDSHVMRICIKTNNNLVEIGLNQIFNQMRFRAHIISCSNEFKVYELPIKNFKYESMGDILREKSIDIINLNKLELRLESEENKEFSIDIKYIELESCNEKYESKFRKYQLPIFMKSNKNI